MQEVFLPDLSSPYRWLSLCAILGIGGVILATAAFRRADFPVRPASQLMGLILGMVGLLGAGFIGWDITRTKSVVVTDTYLLLGNDTIPKARVAEAYLEKVSEYNVMGDPSVREIGIIEFDDGNSQLFGAEQYDVKALINATRQMQGGAAE